MNIEPQKNEEGKRERREKKKEEEEGKRTKKCPDSQWLSHCGHFNDQFGVKAQLYTS